jgi:hypothetical protein
MSIKKFDSAVETIKVAEGLVSKNTVIGGVLWECREVRVDVGGFGVLAEEVFAGFFEAGFGGLVFVDAFGE